MLRRHKTKLLSLEQTRAGLAQRLCQDGQKIVNGVFGDLVQQLVSGKKGPKYSDEVKKFALTLQFYSAKGYNFLRRYFVLPHPSTIRTWASAVDGSAGFTEQAFNQLKEEADKGPVYVTLIFDEVALKKQIDWDGKTTVGYCDLGHGNLQNDDVPEAKEALVFLVAAVNKSWKMPVGYCLINSISADVKCNLIKQYLLQLHEIGVKCIAITCDGTAANISTLKLLGIEFENNIPIDCKFPHPSNETEAVTCFLDACHMLKLARNLLGDFKLLYTLSNNDEVLPVKWEHIEKLHAVQENEHLHLANKISRCHIEWYRQKMKVKLAAQTLSLSVSDAMKFLHQVGVEGFEDYEGTSKYCENFNDMFDLLNSCHPLGKYSKTPIRTTNKDHILRRVDAGMKFLMNLFDEEGNNVLNGKCKTPFMGFYLDLMSVKYLAENLIWCDNPPLKFLLTQKFSQDHLELFFATICNRGGNSNNPTALQFRSAYRRTLLAQISPSLLGNCKPNNTNLLLVNDVPVISKEKQGFSCIRLFNHNLEHDYILPKYESLNLYCENVISYVAGAVTRALTEKSKIKCEDCLLLLFDTESKTQESDLLIRIKDRGGLIHPSADVTNVCKIAEKALRFHCANNKLNSSKNLLNILIKDSFTEIVGTKTFRIQDHLFTSCDTDFLSHYTILVKEILKQYFKIRLHHMAKTQTFTNRGPAVRQIYTKLILFKGQ